MTPEQQQAIAIASAKKRKASGAPRYMHDAPPISTPSFQKAPNAFDSATPSQMSFMDRAKASIKMTPAGEQGFVNSLPGVQDSIRDSEGNLYTLNKDGSLQSMDEDGLTAGDFADMAGGVLESAPAVGVGIATANPLAVGAASAGGNALRQGVSSMLPGDDQLNALDRATMVGFQGVLGGATQKAGNVLFSGADKIRPKNFAVNAFNRKADNAVATDSAFIEQKTGVGFSAGQFSGDDGILRIEGLLRQHPASSTKVGEFDEKQLIQSVDFLNRTLNNYSPRSVSIESVGQDITTGTKRLIGDIVTTRRSLADKDFGLVDSLSKGQGVINGASTKETLSSLIDDFDVPGGGDATASLVGRLKTMAGELEDDLTPKQMNRLLQIYGNASRGSGKIFNDIDSAQQRLIAGRLYRALQDDLDVAAESAEGLYAQALKTARNNYRVESQKITEIEDTVIGKLINSPDKSPESVAYALGRMDGSQLRTTMNVLRQVSPDLADDVQKLTLQEMIETSVKSGSSQKATGALVDSGNGSQAVNFSPAKLLSQLTKPKQADRLKAIYGEAGFDDVKVTTELMRRLVDQPGANTSGTAPMLFARDLLKSILSPKELVMSASGMVNKFGVLGEVSGAKKAVSLLIDPKGRKSLQTLSSAKTWTKGSAAAASYLYTTYGTNLLDGAREPQQQPQ